MAGTIKGITIQLGADTTKLSSALNSANKAIKTTQTSLKGVESALKFSPGNVDLLKDKQSLLSQKIEETKTKLDALKQGLAQMDAQGVDKTSKEYVELKSKMDICENELEQLNNELKEFGSVGAQQVAAVGEKMKTVGDNIANVGRDLTTKVTLPLVAAGTAGAAKFAEVDKTMQLTNATMGNTAQQADLLNKAMKDAAANSTFGMSDAATATLNFARAGLDAEQAAAALAPAMNLAAGEGGNLDTVSGGLVATINGFADSFENTSKYADVFAAACNNSALDVDGLADAMSVAAPIFNAAGYSVNDAALYMGVMANAGIESSVAANSLKTGLARLVSPAKEGAAWMDELGISVTNADGSMKESAIVQAELHNAFQNLSESEQIAAASAIFGKNQMSNWLALINTAPDDVWNLQSELNGASLSVDDFSEKLSDSGMSIDDMIANMEKLGVSQEDFIYYLKDSGGSAEEFADSLHEISAAGVSQEDVINALGGDLGALQGVMNETKGTTDEMAEAMMSGFGGSIEQLKSSIDVAATSLGEALAPTIEKVAEKIQDLVTWFNGLDSEQQETIAKIGIAVAAIGPLLVVIGKVVSSVGTIMTLAPKISGAMSTVTTAFSGAAGGAGGLSGAFAALTGPVGIAVAAIAGIVAIVTTLWKTNEDFRNKITEIWNGVTEKFSEAKEKILGAINSLGFNFESVSEALKAAWTGLCDFLAPIFEGAFKVITTTLEGAMDILSGIIEFWTGIISGNWEQVWQGIVDTATGIFETLTAPIQGILTAIDGFFGGKLSDIKEKVSEALEKVKQFFTEKLDAAKLIAERVLNAIKYYFHAKLEEVKEKVSTVMEAVRLFFQTKLDAIKSKVGTILSWIKSTFTDRLNAIKEAVTSKLTAIRDKFTEIFDGIKSYLEPVIDWLKHIFDFEWKLPEIKLPHFSLKGSFDLESGSVPHLSVDWYDKGGIFRSPTVIGVGEKRPEFVGALDDLRTIVREESGGGALMQEMVRLMTILVDQGGRPITVNQEIYADSTSYAEQQRQAARSFKNIARALA